MSRHSRWPVRVKRGNSTVTIYKADRKKNGRLYREFKLAYYNEIGKRMLQSFNSFKKARKAAEAIAGYEMRFAGLEMRLERMDGKISTLSWMVGVVISLTLALGIGNLFLSFQVLSRLSHV